MFNMVEKSQLYPFVTAATLFHVFGILVTTSAAQNDSTTVAQRNCSFGTLHYLNRSMTQPIQLNCSDYCPPNRQTDSSVSFCWNNCQDDMKCLLNGVKNGENIMRDLQQRATRPNTCPSDTWFYHPFHGFVSCQTVCSTPKKRRFCHVNCPDLFKCLNPPSTTATPSPVNESHLSATNTAANTSDDRYQLMQTDTTTVTAPVTSVSFVNNNVYMSVSERPDNTDSRELDGLLIAVTATVIVALFLLIFIGPIQRRCQRRQRTHVQLSAQPNDMNNDAENADDPPDDISSTRTSAPRTPNSSFHGDQETEQPAESHPLTVSSHIVDFSRRQSTDNVSYLDETAPKSPLIRTSNDCSRSQALYPCLSGPFNFVSDYRSHSQPTETDDNENSEESNARLHIFST